MSSLIDIHTHSQKGEGLVILNSLPEKKAEDKIFFSHGIHPWDIEKVNINNELNLIEDYCSSNKLIAVGEIGLDRAIQTSIEFQKEVFIKQLEISERFQLPVIIHCVKAWSDILEIRKKGKFKNTWIFHGYNGNLQTANQINKSGCFLSFGKALIFSQITQEVFKSIPKENFFLETDDSELNIEEIYKKAAEISDICMDELKSIIYNNFIRIFGDRGLG